MNLRHTVPGVFLLAYTDLRRGERTTLSGCTARSLRRVGADVAVVLNCSTHNAKRLRRDARYDHVVTYSLETGKAIPGRSSKRDHVDVTVLSDSDLVLRGGGPTSMLCELTVDGKTASVGAVDEPGKTLYALLVRIDATHPVILVGGGLENLDDPSVIENVIRSGFVDTHRARPTSEPGRAPRAQGILARGLHSYGDGTYLNPDGCSVHWARLGH